MVGKKFSNGFEIIEAVEKPDEWVILARRGEEYVTARMSHDESNQEEWYWGTYFLEFENAYTRARNDLYTRAR